CEAIAGPLAFVERLALQTQRVQEPREPGPAIAELGATDPVVAVHVRVGDGPAFPDGVGARVRELALDGLALVAGAGLVIRFSRVNRRDHRVLPSIMSFTKNALTGRPSIRDS